MKKSMLFLLACPILLVGCSTPGIKELKSYCEKDAGEWMDEYVYADGYFYNYKGSNSENHYWKIPGWGFDYIEIYKDGYKPWDAIQADGYLRMFRAEKSNPLCNDSFQKSLIERGSEFANDNCVAVEVVDYTRSRYWEEVKDFDIPVENEYGSVINRLEHTITDKERNKTVANFVLYRLTPRPNHPLGYGEIIHCDQGKYYDNAFNINSVIKPRKKRN